MVARKCVSCTASPNELKVLRCMHTACSSCVTRLVDLDNTVECPQCKFITPSPGAGKPQSTTLPAVYNKQSASDGGEIPRVDGETDNGGGCEECTDDTPATSSCTDCQADLCSAHAETHPRVKKTRGHKVGPKKSSASAPKVGGTPKSSSRCSLHTAEELTHFCKRCLDLSCALCLKRKVHADHPNDLLSITEAADNARKECDKTCANTGDGCHAKLAAKLQSLQEGQDDIRRQSEAVSRDISAAFEEKISLLKRRESQLLAEVDKLCWKKLEPLESVCAATNECLQMSLGLANIAEDCASDSDMLKLSPWLEEKAASICKSTEKGHELLRKCKISCLHLSKGLSAETAGDIGLVLDLNDVDTSKSSFDILLPPASQRKQFTISVSLKNSQCEALAESSLYEAVSVVAGMQLDSASAASIEPEGISLVRENPESKPSKWSWQVEKAGCYQVHVKFGNIDLNGSPYDITVPEMELDKVHCDMALDAAHCEGTLALSSDLTRVSTTGYNGQKSVYMTPVNTGVHELRVKFNNPGGRTGQFPVCGIVDAEGPMPLIQDISAGGNFIGFSSASSQNNGKATADSSDGSLYQWQSGAIFTFRINCDRRTFCLRCEQSTGNFDVTWKNIPSKVCVRLGLFHEDSSFEILDR